MGVGTDEELVCRLHTLWELDLAKIQPQVSKDVWPGQEVQLEFGGPKNRIIIRRAVLFAASTLCKLKLLWCRMHFSAEVVDRSKTDAVFEQSIKLSMDCACDRTWPQEALSCWLALMIMQVPPRSRQAQHQGLVRSLQTGTKCSCQVNVHMQFRVEPKHNMHFMHL